MPALHHVDDVEHQTEDDRHEVVALSARTVMVSVTIEAVRVFLSSGSSAEFIPSSHCVVLVDGRLIPCLNEPK